MRDHGGDLDRAVRKFGGDLEAWIDLSTGINRCPYPLPRLAERHWTGLPTEAAIRSLADAARLAYATDAPILATAGAQAAIQMIPHLMPPGEARVLSPTYNEHAASLRTAGWTVREVRELQELKGADLAVVVNPNNPDGRRHDPDTLRGLLGSVGRLIVDESFADALPELSLAPHAGVEKLLVLRSFGKFYGLAGLRLGFVLGSEPDIAALARLSGPWPVSGMAIEIGRLALSDREWAAATRERLNRDVARLDDLVRSRRWSLQGGTPLFRLYDTEQATAAQTHLARSQIWSRAFPWSEGWLRLGIPGNEAEWARLAAALE
jgi:cobalamin biosynthetic protein CobC